MKETLGDRVAAVRLSHKLVSKPVCLTTQGEITLEMERYFANLRRDNVEPMKAQRVLELNASHPIFEALKNAYDGDRELAGKYAELLYGQALLMAGVPLEDASRFSELVCELMK